MVYNASSFNKASVASREISSEISREASREPSVVKATDGDGDEDDSDFEDTLQSKYDALQRENELLQKQLASVNRKAAAEVSATKIHEENLDDEVVRLQDEIDTLKSESKHAFARYEAQVRVLKEEQAELLQYQALSIQQKERLAVYAQRLEELPILRSEVEELEQKLRMVKDEEICGVLHKANEKQIQAERQSQENLKKKKYLEDRIQTLQDERDSALKELSYWKLNCDNYEKKFRQAQAKLDSSTSDDADAANIINNKGTPLTESGIQQRHDYFTEYIETKRENIELKSQLEKTKLSENMMTMSDDQETMAKMTSKLEETIQIERKKSIATHQILGQLLMKLLADISQLRANSTISTIDNKY